VIVTDEEQCPGVMHFNKYKWIYGCKSMPLKQTLPFFCRGKTILDSCPYLSILALHWHPRQINGHKFEGKEGDYIHLPERLLDVPDAEIMTGKSTCRLVHFTEYSSQQWFVTGNNLPVLKNKVICHLKNYVIGI
jgi:hypothetical protein